MDDTVPRLVALILAGGVVLMGLRGHLPDGRRGDLIYRGVTVAFLLVIAFAIVALLRREKTVAPDPFAPSTVAHLRRPAALC